MEDSSKGIEMEADFEGAMHDMPEEEGERDRDSSDEEGDDERIDQQMGDVGDDNEVVDERMWNDEDEPAGEEGGKKEEKYEKDSAVQVRVMVLHNGLRLLGLACKAHGFGCCLWRTARCMWLLGPWQFASFTTVGKHTWLISGST